MIRFGREVKRLRRAHNLHPLDLAQILGTSEAHLYNIERGAKTCGAGLAERLADLFALTGSARAVFLALREELPADVEEVNAPRSKRLPIVRVTCEAGCNHDGRIAPGGSLEGHEREGECLHYAACLGVFAKKHKGATECHCPPACSHRRQEDPALKAASGWGSMTFPNHGHGKGKSAR
jgi:transcriptional regulator with XRE-family HTH domain